jgi:hypothetical protein
LLAICLLSAIGYTLSTIFTTRAQTVPPDATQTGVNLQLIPQSSTVIPGQPVAIEVWLDPNGNRVTAAELRLTFDSQKLTPISASPFTPGNTLALVLPNCEFAEADPCIATSSATANQALMYLGVNCTETGCPIPDTTQRFLLATLHLQSTATASGTTTVTARFNSQPDTLIAALEFELDATKTVSQTTLSFPACHLETDYTGDSLVTIQDLQIAANIWNTNANHATYNGQFDRDRDGDIDIIDLQAAANTWNQNCN